MILIMIKLKQPKERGMDMSRNEKYCNKIILLFSILFVVLSLGYSFENAIYLRTEQVSLYDQAISGNRVMDNKVIDNHLIDNNLIDNSLLDNRLGDNSAIDNGVVHQLEVLVAQVVEKISIKPNERQEEKNKDTFFLCTRKDGAVKIRHKYDMKLLLSLGIVSLLYKLIAYIQSKDGIKKNISPVNSV